jgi:serine/threonine-protein kinase
LRQICGGLEAAHRAGIIHRDLKPENVWVATPAHEESFAKVLDFGIAKLLDNPAGKSTQTGAAMGTPRYMAPEQCMGKAVDHRADIYSLGVILYEIFAGVVPFRGESFGELIYKHMSETPEPPSKHRPVAPELEKLILSCLEKDPAKRPESAKELGRLLEQALPEGGEPVAKGRTAVLGEPVPPSVTTMRQSVGEVLAAVDSPPAPRSRRGPLLAVGATAVVVVVGVLLMRGHSAPAPAAPVTPAPVAAVPAPAAPAPGRIQLRVEGGPADKVSLDGREVAHGVAAFDFGEVAPGAHVVAIEAAGHDSETLPVTVAPGAPTLVSVALKPSAAPTPPPHAGARHAAAHAPAPHDTAAPGTLVPAHVSKPSRAEEHGLMDDNPFRKP